MAIQLKTAPENYIKLDTLPYSISTILLSIATVIPSVNPKTTRLLKPPYWINLV